MICASLTPPSLWMRCLDSSSNRRFQVKSGGCLYKFDQGARARRKCAKKQSLHVVNEHFERFSNAAIAASANL